MANRGLFSYFWKTRVAPADATNAEGAPAYAMSPQHALAQYAVTGCLDDTFYASAEVPNAVRTTI